jgi:preprotein translocase subunit SecG
MTARGAGDLLTRTTWILGTLFFLLSFALTFLSGHPAGSIVDSAKMKANLGPPPAQQQQAPQQAPAQPLPNAAPAPLAPPTPTFHNPFTGQDQPSTPAKP